MASLVPTTPPICLICSGRVHLIDTIPKMYYRHLGLPECRRSSKHLLRRSMRIVAILASYNEERFIAGCIEHLSGQGVEVYLIDNCSTDQTVSIAKQYLGHGLIGIETLPRALYDLEKILSRKESLAYTVDADWFMHADPDEVRLSPWPGVSLAEAFAKVDNEGYNAINFLEYTFVPTLESPNHDQSDFQKTMRWYYPFLREFPHRLNAWKRQPEQVELAWSAGHRVRFRGLRMYPHSFAMRHYLFLSAEHFIAKYGSREFSPLSVQKGWHAWRARVNRNLRPEEINLPSSSTLRSYISDAELDPSNPLKEHLVATMNLLSPSGVETKKNLGMAFQFLHRARRFLSHRLLRRP
jgi:hypothetical protein